MLRVLRYWLLVLCYFVYFTVIDGVAALLLFADIL